MTAQQVLVLLYLDNSFLYYWSVQHTICSEHKSFLLAWRLAFLLKKKKKQKMGQQKSIFLRWETENKNLVSGLHQGSCLPNFNTTRIAGNLIAQFPAIDLYTIRAGESASFRSTSVCKQQIPNSSRCLFNQIVLSFKIFSTILNFLAFDSTPLMVQAHT